MEKVRASPPSLIRSYGETLASLPLHRGSPRRSGGGWRAANDEDAHYVYAVALWYFLLECGSDRKTHNVATLAGASDLLKASFAEGFDKSHEAIAQGIRIDRIGLNDRSAITRGMLDRRAKNLVHKPLSTKFALDEEAGQRPDCFGGCSLHASEGTIRGSRSDRAPSHGCAATIAENPDRHAGVYSGFHRCTAVCAVGLLCLSGS